MKVPKTEESKNIQKTARIANPLLFVCVSVAAIVASFVVANSGYEFAAKAKGFVAILVGYLTFCAITYRNDSEHTTEFRDGSAETATDEMVEHKLFAIEEASKYFGSSLKPADMFRLMSSRVNDLIRFDSCVLLMVDRQAETLRVVHADGEGADRLKGVESKINGSNRRSVASKTVQTSNDLINENNAFAKEADRKLLSSASLPLIKDGEVFAVLQLFSKSKTAFGNESISLLEAISERVAPLVLGSMSFEQSISNALTDPLTNLPNERAFFLIFENQLAESHRNREGRPISLIAIDIKYFADVNERFGHAAGDRLLNFVAEKIKIQLRQMDFFSRSANDEFLVILPTANMNVANEIVGRLHGEFANCKFPVNEEQSVPVNLNFGAATFWQDGETAQMLLATARERKEQSKSSIPSKVVWFPTEYLN